MFSIFSFSVVKMFNLSISNGQSKLVSTLKWDTELSILCLKLSFRLTFCLPETAEWKKTQDVLNTLNLQIEKPYIYEAYTKTPPM